MQVTRQLIAVKQRQVVLELPESFINHLVEVIALTMDEEKVGATGRLPLQKRRRPHPDIAGKGQTLGNLVSPIVQEINP